MIDFTDAEIKEDLWAWNDFQDRLDAQENQSGVIEPESNPESLA